MILRLVWWYRCWTLAHAKDFARRLEYTIQKERIRLAHAVVEAEVNERRAYMDIVKSNADKRRRHAQSFNN